MLRFLLTGVGMLLDLWFLWRSADLAITNIKAGTGERLVFGIGYAFLAACFLFALLIAIVGLH